MAEKLWSWPWVGGGDHTQSCPGVLPLVFTEAPGAVEPSRGAEPPCCLFKEDFELLCKIPLEEKGQQG